MRAQTRAPEAATALTPSATGVWRGLAGTSGHKMRKVTRGLPPHPDKKSDFPRFFGQPYKGIFIGPCLGCRSLQRLLSLDHHHPPLPSPVCTPCPALDLHSPAFSIQPCS